MDKKQEQVQEQSEYTSMQQDYDDTCNLYELTAVRPIKEDKRDEQQCSDTVCSTRGGLQSGVPPPELPVVQVSGRKSPADTRSTNDLHHKSSSCSKPLLFMTVLLWVILILLIIILGIVVYDKYATGNNVECTNTATGASSNSNTASGASSTCNSNTNEWADRIAQNVYNKLNITDCIQKIPNFTQWANDIVSRVNQSLPDFNEWANSVVSKVNSNVTGSLPDFNEWANGVSQNTLQLFQNNTNFTELDKQILQTTRDSAQKLINIVNTLSNLQDTSTSTAGVVDDILLIAQELLVLHNESATLPTSCKELKRQHQTLYSGYYILSSANGTAYTAYCEMYELCGSREGWTRLAYLDMGYSTQNCPSGFRLYQSGGVRACGRQNSNAGCVSVQFPSNGISYSQICGRVYGYQWGSTDAVYDPNYSYRNDINSHYVDGVSITRGSPRQHVWTLMAGESESTSSQRSCPCNTGSSVSVQPFIDSNYFCESGNSNSYISYDIYTDVLWDGYGCGNHEYPNCCKNNAEKWFHRDYGSTTTTDYIELRVCGDEGINDEDVLVYYYKIYVQ